MCVCVCVNFKIDPLPHSAQKQKRHKHDTDAGDEGFGSLAPAPLVPLEASEAQVSCAFPLALDMSVFWSATFKMFSAILPTKEMFRCTLRGGYFQASPV